jgi:hypothetical protein
LTDWKVETVFVPPTSALAQALLLDPHWRTVFSDVQSIVLVRTHSAAESAEIVK